MPLAVLVLPLAVYALAFSFGAAQRDALASAESHFLGLVIACGTALMVALRPGRPAVAIAASGLGVIALMTIGAGTTRGAACMALLLAGLAVAASGGRVGQTAAERLPFLLALGIGVQIFARPQLLLAPHTDGPRLLALLGIPCVLAVCGHVVALHWGLSRVLIAGALCTLVGPGLTLTTMLIWIALAGGAVWRSTTREGAIRPSLAQGTLALTLVIVPIVVLAITGAPLAGGVVALATLLIAADGRGGRIAAGALALLLAFVFGQDVPPAELLAAGLGALVLLPAALRPGLRHLDRMAAAVALLVLAARAGDLQAVAAVLAVLALGLDAKGATLRLQAWWTGTILILALLLAAYPWVRASPREDALALLGLGSSLAVLFAAAALLGAGVLLDLVGKPALRPPWSARLVIAAAAAALLTTAPAPPVDTFSPAIALDAERGGWKRPLGGPRSVRSVVLESSLTNSLALPEGALLATVTLRDADGETLGEWPLRSGRDTAEWAAERADVAARLGDRRPDPYAAAVAEDGTFFARRYRTRFTVEQPVTGATQVVVRRIRRLPEAVQLVLHRVEVAP